MIRVVENADPCDRARILIALIRSRLARGHLPSEGEGFKNPTHTPLSRRGVRWVLEFI